MFLFVLIAFGFSYLGAGLTLGFVGYCGVIVLGLIFDYFDLGFAVLWVLI